MLSQLSLRSALWAALVSLTYLQALPPQSVSSTELNLADLGWQPPPSALPRGVGTQGRLIALDHHSRIVFGFVARDSETLSTRGEPKLNFHVIRITLKGEKDLSTTLPTDSWFNNGIYLDARDNIVARANRSLQFLSTDRTLESENAPWRKLSPCSAECTVSQSPTRRTTVVEDYEDVSRRKVFVVIDTSLPEPQVLRQCTWIKYLRLTGGLTDKFGYWGLWDAGSYVTRRYPICDADHAEELPLHDSFAGALNDNRYAVSETPANKFIVGVDDATGSARFQLPVAKHEISPARVQASEISETGDRFAVEIPTVRGGNELSRTTSHIIAARLVVLDTETGSQIAVRNLETNSSASTVEFTLSPDGRRIALLQGGILTLISLP